MKWLLSRNFELSESLSRHRAQNPADDGHGKAAEGFPLNSYIGAGLFCLRTRVSRQNGFGDRMGFLNGARKGGIMPHPKPAEGAARDYTVQSGTRAGLSRIGGFGAE